MAGGSPSDHSKSPACDRADVSWKPIRVLRCSVVTWTRVRDQASGLRILYCGLGLVLACLTATSLLKPFIVS
jgi:hypothetical protein